tara:strand:+ start:82 stop:1005 length:924 start_codon:yes stop_codon:yes gene_type:complete
MKSISYFFLYRNLLSLNNKPSDFLIRCFVVCWAALLMTGCNVGKSAAAVHKQQKLEDVKYGVNERNVMDVYLPAERKEDTPFVVLIHGGAWVKAGKEYVREIQDTILNNGIAVASINHRYADINNIHYKEMVDDVDQALSYCSANAKNWGTRSEGFTLVGASSGGHLALLTAYTTTKNIKSIVDFSGPTNVNDTTMLDYASQAGLLDLVQMMTGKAYKKGEPLASEFLDSSPLSHVKNIPVLIVHGTDDLVVPFSQSQVLDSKLDSLGYEHKLLKIPEAGHDLNLKEYNNRELIYGEMIDWIRKYGK